VTTFIEDHAVPLADIADKVGVPLDQVQAEAEALGFYIGEDWAQRAALSASDAYAIVSGNGRRELANSSANHAWQVSHSGWIRDREAARRAAYHRAFDSARASGASNSYATELGHEAARVELVAFDRQHPEPRYADPAEQKPSWFARARKKVA
jgi:hypothetical protein